jgi:hypothetical protein
MELIVGPYPKAARDDRCAASAIGVHIPEVVLVFGNGPRAFGFRAQALRSRAVDRTARPNHLTLQPAGVFKCARIGRLWCCMAHRPQPAFAKVISRVTNKFNNSFRSNSQIGG